MHFICDKCHVIYDIENDENSIKKQLQTINKHEIKTIQINMTGICHKCLDNLNNHLIL